MKGFFSAALFSAKLGPVTRFALVSLRANARRNGLALFGIAVGLAAVVGLSLAGRSAEKLALDSFKHLALDLITIELPLVNPDQHLGLFGGGGKPSAAAKPPAETRTPAQSLALLEGVAKGALGEPKQAWSIFKGSCEFAIEGGSTSMSVATAGPGMLKALGVKLAQGRDLHVLDSAAPWALLGYRLSERVAEAGGKVELGRPLLLCGVTVYVAGVLAPAPANSDLIGESPDEIVFIQDLPFRQLGIEAQQLTLVWRVKNEAQVEPAGTALRDALRAKGQAQATVRTAASMVALKRQQAGQQARLITLLGGISVLVGGLGIMNVMLVSGLERRHDIAVCMALGADRVAIAWQFLVESTVLGVCGGVLGIAAGHALAWLALRWLGMPWQPELMSSLAALGLGATVGALSGLYPALKVSQIDPSVVLAS